MKYTISVMFRTAGLFIILLVMSVAIKPTWATEDAIEVLIGAAVAAFCLGMAKLVEEIDRDA